ncbi:MAG: inositol monophosphatase family protein [Pseudomonadota bacterium]
MPDDPRAALHEIIITAAREELLPRFAAVTRARKADGSVLTEADLALQARVAERLRARWPDTVFLGEEMTPAEQQVVIASQQPVWCLDPLDGTSNFACGIPYFCVSLSLLQGGTVQLGLVYDPLRDECFDADPVHGARLNGVALHVADPGLPLAQATALVDFKRLALPLRERLIKAAPYASQRSFGSVALDWCWLAAGRGHLYLHGRSSIWDYAAGQFIFTRAGGAACTLQGEPVFTQALTPRSSVAAVSAPLFAAWSDWLGVPAQ